MRCIVAALEALKTELAKMPSTSARSTCMQEAIAALFGTFLGPGTHRWGLLSLLGYQGLYLRLYCLYGVTAADTAVWGLVAVACQSGMQGTL